MVKEDFHSSKYDRLSNVTRGGRDGGRSSGMFGMNDDGEKWNKGGNEM